MLHRRTRFGHSKVGSKNRCRMWPALSFCELRRSKRPADFKGLLRRRIRLEPSGVYSKKQKQNVTVLISNSWYKIPRK
ncbi:uncharacterized protein LOC116843743 isoform X2 [Odontomachus brunneus]|uniref:uncharacterized protein LOC116843743 isoform X2 n=1 Tax=Odontomachus brunneus TaxID=486640 RepID=UPI0013F1F479|nr:uncharacterized protein LOC116843743 isoform X2 [Odontomachus brunneus]